MVSYPDPHLQPPGAAEPISPAAPAAAPLRDPVWSGWDVLLLAAVAILGILLFSTLGIVALVVMTPGHKPPGTAEVTPIALMAQLLAYLVVVGVMYLVVVVRYRRRFWEAVRWRWPVEKTAAPALVVAGAVIALLVQLASAWLPVPKQLPIYEFLKDTAAAYLMAAFGTLVAPFVEEMFFRGFLYPVLARRVGVAAGVVLTSIGFALIHASQLGNHWAPLLVLFVVGLTFTLARAWTGSVAVPFLLHLGYNGALFTLLYITTDRFRHMERMLQ